MELLNIQIQGFKQKHKVEVAALISHININITQIVALQESLRGKYTYFFA